MSDYSLAVLFILVGLVLALNPLSISVFSALMAGAIGRGHPRRVLRNLSLMFILTFSLFLALFCIFLARIFNAVSVDIIASVGIAVALAAIVVGLVNIKDYFWYGPKIKMPKSLHQVVMNNYLGKNNTVTAAYLGVIAGFSIVVTAGVELLCLAIILALLRPNTFLLMIVPAICLTLPLLIIFVGVYRGIKLSAILKWKEDNKPLMRLSAGFVAVLLGWILLLILNGSIGSAI